jgi:hypothetical protein
MRTSLLTLALTFTACDKGSDSGDVDYDGDGYTVADGDCDDTEATTYPGAAEESDTDAIDQNRDSPGE